MAIALSSIVLVGLGVAAFLFFRGGDEDVAGPTDTTETSISEDAAGGSGDDGSLPIGAPFVNVANEAAAIGPLQSGTAYEMLIDSATPGAQLQYVVDGNPVGEPFVEPTTLTLEPGRHTIAVSQTTGTTTTVGDAIAVYVLGETPARSYRANLKSVNIQTEGWAEAVNQFDLISQTHPDLKLTPSDPYPSLTPGYWNLYIDGFSSSQEALDYCNTSGLAVPDECFSKLFDPAAAAPSN